MVICRKWLVKKWQLAIFKTKMATPFSLEYQRKVFQFVICHFILLNIYIKLYIYNINPLKNDSFDKWLFTPKTLPNLYLK